MYGHNYLRVSALDLPAPNEILEDRMPKNFIRGENLRSLQKIQRDFKIHYTALIFITALD